jgi:hypothetical protein
MSTVYEYINAITNEVLTHAELCKRVSTSIVPGRSYEDWYPVGVLNPVIEAPEGHYLQQGNIIKIEEGVYAYDWKFVKNPSRAARIPRKVSNYQFRIALHREGLLNNVTSAMSDIITSAPSQLAWSFLSSFDRNSEMIKELMVRCNFTEQAMDAFFLTASKVKES